MRHVMQCTSSCIIIFDSYKIGGILEIVSQLGCGQVLKSEIWKSFGNKFWLRSGIFVIFKRFYDMLNLDEHILNAED